MNQQDVISLTSNAIFVAIQIGAPALIAALATGLLVSIFQAATQINEQTLSFIPKILAMTITLVVAGPWILQTMLGFTMKVFNGIPALTH